MKSVILLVSLTLTLLATCVAIIGTLSGGNVETIATVLSVSTYLGLGGIGAFFVGLAFPNTVVSGRSSNGRVA